MNQENERMSRIEELAQSLGRALGGTPEYRTLARAKECADDDREMTRLRNRFMKIEESVQAALQRGEQPASEDMERYEAAMGELQALSVYQSLVAAQANFDRIMQRVDGAIQEGMRSGAASPIILTS
ncbi:MAG: YlbF family regulator [Gemmatimonadetes bacterium]|nr:YlbF family regulator [Gemmatimonadota bacterium]